MPSGVLSELTAIDSAVYTAVAATDTPQLDVFFRRLSRTADKSVLWLGVAAALAAAGGSTGRRAAVNGVASIARTIWRDSVLWSWSTTATGRSRGTPAEKIEARSQYDARGRTTSSHR